jgi:hypothetical protein
MDLEKTELSSVIRNTTFSALANSIVLDTGETVTAVSMTADISDSGITLATSLSAITVSGSYLGLFDDYGEYVSRGSSNLIETPTEFTNIDNLPPNKDFYLFEQDSTPSKTVVYTVTVIYDKETTTPDDNSPPGAPTVTTETDLVFVDTFNHEVKNSHTLGYDIVSAYYI